MYQDVEYIINNEKIGELTQKLYDILTGIQWGKIEDTYGWIQKI
jgi:branched-chain amino acid aminotransferase